MDAMTAPIGQAQRTVVCPNCGSEQAIAATEDPRCQRCGEALSANPRRTGAAVAGAAFPGQADPTEVAPPMASGSLGAVTDGTQVPHSVPTPVPGKPMAPIADDPAGSSTFEAQALDPSPGPHAERGGSG